jgi:hypothetical protein
MGHQNILTLVDYFETMNNLYLVTDLSVGKAATMKQTPPTSSVPHSPPWLICTTMASSIAI